MYYMIFSQFLKHNNTAFSPGISFNFSLWKPRDSLPDFLKLVLMENIKGDLNTILKSLLKKNKRFTENNNVSLKNKSFKSIACLSYCISRYIIRLSLIYITLSNFLYFLQPTWRQINWFPWLKGFSHPGQNKVFINKQEERRNTDDDPLHTGVTEWCYKHVETCWYINR